ncbi:MAG: hypothetical protein ABI792_04545 [bacterium]
MTNNNIPEGSKYSIVFFDSLENKLSEGTISFDKYAAASASGDISINKRVVENFKGSDLINGSFAGSFIKETLQLVLPPKAADYNVYINLNKNGSGFLGSWTFTTRKGNENKGRVICKKI